MNRPRRLPGREPRSADCWGRPGGAGTQAAQAGRGRGLRRRRGRHERRGLLDRVGRGEPRGRVGRPDGLGRAEQVEPGWDGAGQTRCGGPGTAGPAGAWVRWAGAVGGQVT
ncbi:hypothetical protein GCM10009634_19120 [Saccharothrix xinjiangensis]